jgi:hypothetical protein
VDDSPSACSSAWIDSENSHAVTLGTGPDVPPGAARAAGQLATASSRRSGMSKFA